VSIKNTNEVSIKRYFTL